MRGSRAGVAVLGLLLTGTLAYPAADSGISGTVRDAATGLPVADVLVVIHNSNSVEVCSEWTSSAGVYSCAGLAAGSYYVRTSVWASSASRGYVDELYDGVACPFETCPVTSGTPVPVTAGALTTGIDFSLAPGGRISGTVTDAATGLPLSSAAVTIYRASGSSVASGYTDGTGVYTSEGGLPSGNFYARTSNSRGYFDEVYADLSCPSGACSVTDGTPIGVTAGVTTAGIDFALAPGGRVGGTVTDAVTGMPLSGVQVGIFDWTGRSAASGTTNASGSFTTDKGLRSGTYYARTHNSLGYVDELYDDVPCTGGSCTVTRGAPIVVTAGETTGIAFALRPGGRISGTVTLAGTVPPYEDPPVQVRIYDASGRLVSYDYVDASGSYTPTSGWLPGPTTRWLSPRDTSASCTTAFRVRPPSAR